MSELYPTRAENHEAPHAAETHIEQRPTTLPEQRTERQAAPQPNVELLRQDIEKAAVSAQETQQNAVEHTEPANAPLLLTGNLKQASYKRNLRHVRHNLRKDERLLSKVIHQPTVRTVSEFTAKTAGRPSGLLGGGICAFLGSAGFLYAARYIGFSYNYFVFSLFFIGGFIIGLLLELVIASILRLARRSDTATRR